MKLFFVQYRGLILLDHNVVADNINDPGKIKSFTSCVCWDLFAHTFFDPSIGGLYIMCWMNTVHETDRFVCTKFCPKFFVSRQPLLLLLFIGLTGHHRRFFIGKRMPL